MLIISKHDYLDQPWKNGAGLTREIFREDDDARLTWRLSLAAVTSDGAFSTFSGFDRVLTVVEGKGMQLTGGGMELVACPLCPVRFSGDLELTGVCVDGPVINFNLIFDRSKVDAGVELVSGPIPPQPAPPQGSLAIHVLSGRLQADGNGLAAPSDTVVFGDGGAPELLGAWRGLVVTLRPRPIGC